MNVLISSAGRRVELLKAFQRTLQQRGGGRVWAADLNAMSPAMKAADGEFVVPRCTSPDYVPTLLDFCRSEKIGVLVPTIDTELLALAQAREEFQRIGTWVHVSAPETILISQDKRTTHEWLVANGFPVPNQVSATGDLESISLPAIAKPARGSASLGVQEVQTREDVTRLARDPDYVFQSIAAGTEYTVDAFVDDQGRCLCAVPRKRIEVRAGEVSKGCTFSHVELQQLVSTIAEALPGAQGVINIQVFLDAKSGDMRVIEINPRFGGGVPLTFEAGVPLVDWVLDFATGTPQAPMTGPWEDGLYMLRYDAAVFERTKETDG